MDKRRRHAEAQARYRKSQKGADRIKAYRKTAASRRTNRNWYLNNKYKVAAHKLVRLAVEAGRLVKEPCEVCGKSNAHAHHEDYDKPLDITWLCPTHHKERHRKGGDT